MIPIQRGQKRLLSTNDMHYAADYETIAHKFQFDK